VSNLTLRQQDQLQLVKPSPICQHILDAFKLKAVYLHPLNLLFHQPPHLGLLHGLIITVYFCLLLGLGVEIRLALFHFQSCMLFACKAQHAFIVLQVVQPTQYIINPVEQFRL